MDTSPHMTSRPRQAASEVITLGHIIAHFLTRNFLVKSWISISYNAHSECYINVRSNLYQMKISAILILLFLSTLVNGQNSELESVKAEFKSGNYKVVIQNVNAAIKSNGTPDSVLI